MRMFQGIRLMGWILWDCYIKPHLILFLATGEDIFINLDMKDQFQDGLKFLLMDHPGQIPRNVAMINGQALVPQG